MRITLIRQYFATREQPGSTRGFEFSRRLVERGHDVTVITSNHREEGNRPSSYEASGIKIISIPNYYDQSLSYHKRIKSFISFALKSSLFAIRQPSDVIMASSTPLTVAIPGIMAATLKRVPFVFEVRDLWPEMPIAMGALSGRFSIGLARALEWIAYKNSSAVVALSPGMALGVEARGIPPERVAVIPNSSDLDLWPGISDQDSRSEAETFVVVYAGSIGIINGPDYLVDLANALYTADPRFRVRVVGAGAEEERVRGVAQAQGLLDSAIEFYGIVPKNDIAGILNSADLGLSIFLPLKEMEANSANKFFDYLAAGLPVALNYGGWQAEIVERSGAGLLLSRDPERAASQIIDFLSDRETVRTASVAARKLAEEHFSRDTQADQLNKLLSAVVARDKSSIATVSLETRDYVQNGDGRQIQ